MNARSTDEFFDFNIKLLKIAGLWVPDQGENFASIIFYWTYNVLVNGFSLIFYVPSEFVAFKDSARNMDDMIKNASVAVTHLLAALKVIVWFRRRKEILAMIKDLQQKASQYEPINDFKPSVILEEEKSTKNKTTFVFLVLAIGVSTTAFLGALLMFFTDYEQFLETNVNNNNCTEFVYTQNLPYWVWVPFDHRSSRLRFFIVIFYTCFTPFQQAFVIVGTDTLFTTLISYISAQLRILCGAFQNVRSKCVSNFGRKHFESFHDSNELSEAMMKEMNKCIDHLQVVFRSCKKMEEIYTYLTLAQVLMSEILICTCLFLVSSIPFTSKAFATELVYLVAIELQIALYCFFGNKVTLRGEEISLALYQGDWLSSSTSFKKSMLITMTRMRRPIYLTIGKFSPLTLSTFVTIGRGSYSFFAVLKNSNV